MSPHLSLDIQVEIVKWLPVKSLVQFRSVCKAWKLFIDSPRFIAGYNVCHDHLLIVGFGKDEEVEHVSFVDDDTFPHQKFTLTVPSLLQAKLETMIGSSHGLLCFTGYYQESEKLTQMVFLWNPAIRKSIAVVVSDNNNNVVGELFSYVVGFGVCPDTKDPKRVKITYIDIDDFREMESIISIPCQVMVFTLSSGKWTTSSCTNLPRISIEFTSSYTVIGQFIYWLAFDRIYVDVVDGDAEYEYRSLIMSFDMSTEEFREIELPYSFEMCDPEDLFVSRLRESLVVVEYTSVVERKCDVWLMEHGDFTKLFSINVSGWTLGFRKSGEPIVLMKSDNKDFKAPYALVLYEPCSEHIKDLGVRLFGRWFSLETYTESLLLLDHEDGHIVRCGAVKS